MQAAFSLEPYRALHNAAGFFVRDDRARILLRGDDRRAYLHGLLSNDIAGLTPGTGCYAALLTPQGRMISDMRVFELGDAILMDLELPVASAVRAHLENFIITEDVTVEDATGALAQIGVYGPHAEAIVETARRMVELRAVLPSDDLGVAGFDLIVERTQLPALNETLLSGATPVSAATLDVTRIEAGIPRFLVDMDATTIPLEAGIEDRAISMTKGCYVGQEVIVRVLHRGGGRVAKKLVGLSVPAGTQRGDLLFAEEREIGRITSAADSPRYGHRIALGYVQRDFVEAGTRVDVAGEHGRAAATVLNLRNPAA